RRRWSRGCGARRPSSSDNPAHCGVCRIFAAQSEKLAQASASAVLAAGSGLYARRERSQGLARSTKDSEVLFRPRHDGKVAVIRHSKTTGAKWLKLAALSGTILASCATAQAETMSGA